MEWQKTRRAGREALKDEKEMLAEIEGRTWTLCILNPVRLLFGYFLFPYWDFMFNSFNDFR